MSGDEGHRGGGRPIWEMELIISGAVIFGLFQLPDSLSNWFEDVAAHLSHSAYWLPYFAYYLGMMAAVGLTAVFCVHFAVRCLWVGILGLQNAFPGGVDWERIDLGPLQRRLYERTSAGLETLGPQLDRLASSLFAVLFVVVVYVVLVAVMIGICYAVSWPLARFLPWLSQTQYFFLVTFGLMVAPLTLSGILVQVVDSRMASDQGFAERHPRWVALADRLLRITFVISGSRYYQPVLLTLRSRISNARFLLVSNLLVVFFVVLVVAVMMVSLGILRGDSYRYFPDQPGAMGYDPDHYASHRDMESPVHLPWISDEVIDEPLLRLFLPFRARHGNALVAQGCPELAPFHGDGLRLAATRDALPENPDRVREARDCLLNLYQLSLNGEPLEGEALFAEDPISEVKGLLIFVPGERLEPGRNHLEVARRERLGLGEGDDRLRHFHIPFWYQPGQP